MSMDAPSHRWFLRPRPSVRPRGRVIAFPHAGASAEAFFSWAELLGDALELCAVQLPGRGRRLAEPRFESVHPLADALVEHALPPLLDCPYVLLGHSVGALVAFEVARRLEQRGRPPPRRVVLSSHRAPGRPLQHSPLHDRPDDELWQGVAALGGMAPEILEHAELRSLLLPALRSDLRICETYEPVDTTPIGAPITALYGTEDPDVSAEDVAAWADFTRAELQLLARPGNHFHLYDHRRHPPAVESILAEALA